MAYIYCGPPIPQAGLTRFRTYKGEPPDTVKKHVAASPAIRRLFVRPGELKRVRQKINAQGTKENLYYRQAVEYVQQLQKGGSK